MSAIRWVLPYEVHPPKDGACIGYPTDWWFPERHAKGERARDFLVAKEICRECHAKVDCLEYAISAQEMHGIWGGMSLEERERIIRQRKQNGTLKLFTKIAIAEDL
jgi:WhiB family redox-sensing transcriptional regulator